MLFLNLEYGTRPAPQAVKRKKEKKRRSETNLMQCARPDDAHGDERRAGTPRERGREGEGGEADNNGSNHNNGNKSKRRPKGRRTRETDKNNDRTEKKLLRTTQIAQNHSDCSGTAHSSHNKFSYPNNFYKLFPKRIDFFPASRQCGADSQGRRTPFLQERRRTAEGPVSTGAPRDLCGGLPVVQPRPTFPFGGGETTRHGW